MAEKWVLKLLLTYLLPVSARSHIVLITTVSSKKCVNAFLENGWVNKTAFHPRLYSSKIIFVISDRFVFSSPYGPQVFYREVHSEG